MLSLTWRETRPALLYSEPDPLPPPRLLRLLGKTSVLGSAHSSRPSAVHNHETACGTPRFNTPTLNRGARGSGSPKQTGLIQSPSALERRPGPALVPSLNALRPSRSPHLSPLLRLAVVFWGQASSLPTPGDTKRRESTPFHPSIA